MKQMAFTTKLLMQWIVKYALTGALLSVFISTAFAANITSTAGGGNWSNAATWVGGVVPGAGDNVTIAGNVTVDIASASTNVTINAGATLSLNHTLTVGGNWLNNGTFNYGCQCPNNTVIMTGNGSTMGGTSTTTFYKLTINTPGATNMVSLSNSNFKLENGGTLTLQNGIFKIGAANSFTMSNGQSTTITRVNGNLASAADGTGLNTDADGGTINAASQSGANITVNGNVNFYNIKSTADANWHLELNSTGTRINGTLTAVGTNSWGFATTGNAPIWGPNSTYYLDRANQGLAWTNADLSWVAMASGTIGVTPGYPNNVILTNLGSSQTGDATGLGLTGNVAINGTLTVGDGITNGRISMAGITSFNSGGIVINNNSLIIGPPAAATFINRGNFTLQGATTGIFQNSGATINFAGSGTSGSPQLISTTGTSITFLGMIVSNGTYVQLQDPVNLTNSLTMTAGYVLTTNTNILTVTNTSPTAVTGGSATAFVDGPLGWTVPATTTNNYIFPVGDFTGGSTYLPLTLSPNSTSGATVTVTAFHQNSNGNPDATITTISPTEYWSLTTSSPLSGSPLVSVTRPTPAAPYNSLGMSTASNGLYTAIGGTPSGNTISGGGIGSGSPVYVVMATAPLGVIKLGGVHVTCTGTTGSLVVGGTGGTAPYNYSIDGGAFQASGTFSPLTVGDHLVTVQDNSGATATTTHKVLGSLIINGNGKDVDICAGQSTTLTATNLLNTTPTYSWSTNASGTPVIGNTASISVSPTVATDYYVTSQLYNNNLLVNGSFESGNTGFTSSYQNYTGAQYGTTPGNNGYYSISNAGTNQCQWFSTNGVSNGPSLAPQHGGLYFVGDGATASSMVWSQTVTGLTVGTVYKFQFYYAAADPDATRAVLRTTISGGTLTGGDITTTNATAWTQATYTFTASAASATITLTNLTATGNTNGNDFYLDNMEFLSPCTVTSSIKVTLNCLLPVEYLYFNAVRKGEDALLTWATVTENNSMYFVVERSTDGFNYYPIGKVAAAGSSSSLNQYNFTDLSLSSGITYYRLAQYDIDGTVHYSEAKIVTKDTSPGILVTPNPTAGAFNLFIEHETSQQYQVSIYNSLGQVVYISQATSGIENNISISHLSTGVYYLQVFTQEEIIVTKVVKE